MLTVFLNSFAYNKNDLGLEVASVLGGTLNARQTPGGGCVAFSFPECGDCFHWACPCGDARSYGSEAVKGHIGSCGVGVVPAPAPGRSHLLALELSLGSCVT